MTISGGQRPITGGAAIIGMALAIPDATSTEQLHTNLARGRDSVRPIPDARFRLLGREPHPVHLPAALLPSIEYFDHAFFGLSPREARCMDPHQRMMLQLAWQAVEDAGYAVSSLRTSRVGVFLTSHNNGYWRLLGQQDTVAMLGNAPSALAGRVSYLFGFQGPSLVIDSGCSSGLVALDLACAALALGSCDIAVVGGISLRTSLEANVAVASFPELLATSGRCRAFDADADGTSDGEGGVVFLVKPLDRALADRDHVRGVIKSVAIEHNGNRSNGFSAPSPTAQAQLLSRAWQDADIRAEDLLFVEAHGSGTQLGDAIEVTAVQAAWRRLAGADARQCQLASIKTNIGHLDHVAGLVGLAKAVVALESGHIYPSLHFARPNQMVRWDGSVRVTTEDTAVVPSSRNVIGVSSFSLTGTNAHVVVGGATANQPVQQAPTAEIVTLSARSATALHRYARTLWKYLSGKPELPWWQVSYVLNAGRDDMPHRLAFVATSRQSLLDGLYESQLRAEPTERGGLQLVFNRAAGPLSATVCAAVAGFAPHLAMTGQAGQYAGLLAVLGELGIDAVEPDYTDTNPAVLSLRRPDGSSQTLLSAADSGSSFFAALATLYEYGFDIDWDAYYAGRRQDRLPLPGYQFDPVRCWPEPLASQPTPAAAQAAPQLIPQDVGAGAAQPASPMATRMGSLWQSVLGIAAPDEQTHYFAVGGNSVLALELLAKVNREFGSSVKLSELYEHPTLGRLCALVSSGQRNPAETIVRRDGDRSSYVPSFGQESLWILDQMWPGMSIYNIPVDIPLVGAIDVDVLTRAFSDLVERHEVLRSRLVVRDGQLMVVVDDETAVDFQLVDVRGADRTPQQLWEIAYEMAYEDGIRPFRLDVDRPMRARLYRIDAELHLLLLVTHHSADDGWTPGQFMRDLSVFYAARQSGQLPQLPDLPVQYGDFAIWQREYWTGERLAKALDFWRERLAGAAPSNLPTDHPRPAQQSGRGAHYRFTLDRTLVADARQLGHQQGVSLFIIFMSAFKAALARWSGQYDITVGITTAGRDQAEVHDLIGYFNNAVPLRTDLSGDPGFDELIERERLVVSAALQYDGVPFAEVVQAVAPLRDTSRHPLFQVGITHQHLPRAEEYFVPGVRLDRTRTRRMAGLATGTAKWDLDLGVWDRDQDDGDMPAVLEYSTDLFELATIEQFAESFVQILREVTSDPRRRLSDIPIASSLQRRTELSLGAGSEVEVGDQHDPLSLLQRAARKEPDRVFVRHGEFELTYAQLEGRSRELAARLHAAGATPGGRVASKLTHGTDTVVALFAAWLAGCAWVPLDSGAPPQRIRHLLADAVVDVLVVDRGADDADLHDVDVPRVEAAWANSSAPNRADSHLAVEPTTVAYVIYTSGSTGTPKGVLVPMFALRHYCAHWAAALPANCSLLTTASPAFDVFIGDVMRALTAAGTVTVASPTDVVRPAALADLLDRHHVSVTELAPAAARQGLVELLRAEGRQTPLRLLINGSEIWTGADLAATRAILAESGRVLNLYGVTECTIDSVTFLDDGSVAAQDEVPIGSPMANTNVYVLDQVTLEPMPRGAIGEICVGGPRVAAGYIGRPAMTAERFVPDPFGPVAGGRLYRTGDLGRRGCDGRLRFLGRLDRQLKINGVRIEPGEVEAALRLHPLVGDAVVHAVERDQAGQALGALVEVDRRATSTLPDELRRSLAERLPPQLVPAVIVAVDRLPRLPNAKPDLAQVQRLLSTSAPTESGTSRPKDWVDLELVRMFSEVLGREVGLDHHFFVAGGTSLLAIRLIAEIGGRLGVELPVSMLFQAPTAAGVAEAVRQKTSAHAAIDRTIVEIRADEDSAPPLFLVHASGGDVLSYYRFAQALPGPLRVLGVRSRQPVEDDTPVLGIVALAAEYVRQIRPVLGDGELLIAGWSFGGVMAFEIARQWRQTGGRVGFLGLIDAEADPPAQSFPDDEADILASLLVLNTGLSFDDIELHTLPKDERFSWIAQRAREQGAVSRHMSDADLRRLLRVNLRNDAALAAYSARPFAGHGHVFRSTDNDGRHRPDDLGWRSLLDSFTTIEVPGGHYNLFTDHSEALAEIFGRTLRAQRRQGGSVAQQ